MMKKTLIFVCMLAVSLIQAEMVVNLSFSTDEGKTWSEKAPVLTDGQREFQVKATWKVETNEPTKIVTTLLCSPDKDFASANRGRKAEYGEERKDAWCQLLRKYYCGPKSPRPFIYKVDLGERKDGIMGVKNEWDVELKKFVNKPLPPLAAYEPGTYKFTLFLICWGPKEKLFHPAKDFEVTIQ